MSIGMDIQELVAELLPEREMQTLMLQLMESQGSASDDELRELVEWAQGVRFESVALGLVLKGEVTVKLVNGEAHFTAKAVE